jgi:hypothetical protein
MSTKEKIKGIFKSRLKLEPGTRVTSFLFIATSIAIAAGILIAANMYYNIDTGEVVVEEIQRVSNVLRATAGLIVGGTATQNPSQGYVFEVVGQSKLATTTIATGPLTLSAANQELRFTGGTTNYVGFRATTTLSVTSVYTWPASYPAGSGYVLTSDTSGNMSWVAAGTGGIGDVTGVGDCASGDCFTGAQENYTLTFKRGTVYGYLTLASGGANATYALPAVSAGTYYFALTQGALTSGRIPIVSGDYTLGDNANLTFNTLYNALVIGGPGGGNQGQLRIYSQGGGYLAFSPTSTLSSNVIYHWPQYPIQSGQVLASDSSGNLYWLDLSSAGLGDILAVGDCASGDCFTGTTGSTLWFKSNNGGVGALTIGALTANATYTLPAVPSGTYYFTLATTTFSSGQLAVWAGNNLISGTDVLTISGDSLFYKSNYPLAVSGKQILREVIPIFGFDLPVKTATTSYVQISRTIVNYPLNPCESGASRVHKLVIRYGATATSTWQVATSSGGYAELTVPPTGATSTGSVYTIQTDIPTPSGSCSGWNQGTETDDWWVRMRLNDTGEIMIYQIFLAGYDQLP